MTVDVDTDLAFARMSNDYSNVIRLETQKHIVYRQTAKDARVVHYITLPRQSGKTTTLRELVLTQEFGRTLFVGMTDDILGYGRNNTLFQMYSFEPEKFIGTAPFDLILVDEYEYVLRHQSNYLHNLVFQTINKGILKPYGAIVAVGTPY